MTNFEKYNFYVLDVCDNELCINLYKTYIVYQANHHLPIESTLEYDVFDDSDIEKYLTWLFSECE